MVSVYRKPELQWPVEDTLADVRGAVESGFTVSDRNHLEPIIIMLPRNFQRPLAELKYLVTNTVVSVCVYVHGVCVC